MGTASRVSGKPCIFRNKLRTPQSLGLTVPGLQALTTGALTVGMSKSDYADMVFRVAPLLMPLADLAAFSRTHDMSSADAFSAFDSTSDRNRMKVPRVQSS